MSNEKIKNFLKNLEEVDLSKIIEDLKQKEEETKQRLLSFYNSPRFVEIISKMKEEIKMSKHICDNAYSDFVFADVTNDEYCDVFSVLFHKDILNLPQSQEEDNPFANEVVYFDEMMFVMMHGQGTAYILKEDNRKINLK